MGTVMRTAVPPIFSAIGSVINPSFGGAIGGIVGALVNEIHTKTTEGKYLERRLLMLENYLGNDIEIFSERLTRLNEHDYYTIKRLIKYHCFEAIPETTDITAKIIIDYILNSSERSITEQIIQIICQLTMEDLKLLKEMKYKIVEQHGGNYKKTFEWKDFCKYNLHNSDGSIEPMNVSTMLSSSGDDNSTETFSMLFDAIAYTHIKELKLINSAHTLYPGMINEVDIDLFSLTPIGEKIMGYIDLEEK